MLDMATHKRDETEPLLRVYTIGHSTRLIKDFVGMLKAHEVEFLIDVRTVPRSRHNPQFNLNELSAALECDHICYIHMPGLGGFRRPLKGATRNLGWRNLSFRGYADYMQTDEFAGHLSELVAIARLHQIAIMCAEAVPWRCHRSLLADALLVRGFQVQEITTVAKATPLILHSWAQVNGTQVTYPASPPAILEDANR